MEKYEIRIIKIKKVYAQKNYRNKLIKSIKKELIFSVLNTKIKLDVSSDLWKRKMLWLNQYDVNIVLQKIK